LLTEEKTEATAVLFQQHAKVEDTFSILSILSLLKTEQKLEKYTIRCRIERATISAMFFCLFGTQMFSKHYIGLDTRCTTDFARRHSIEKILFYKMHSYSEL
jgi:hypothetical protein